MKLNKYEKIKLGLYDEGEKMFGEFYYDKTAFHDFYKEEIEKIGVSVETYNKVIERSKEIAKLALKNKGIKETKENIEKLVEMINPEL